MDGLDKPCKRSKVEYIVIDEDHAFADIPLVADTVIVSTVGLRSPFCRCDEAGPRKREHEYPRRDSRKRHVRAQHLTDQAVGEGFDCPYEGCMAFLGTATHFLKSRKCINAHTPARNRQGQGPGAL